MELLKWPLEYIKELGFEKGLLAFFFAFTLAWNWWINRKLIKSMQAEIDRLAEDNHMYRDRYLDRLDRRYGREKSK